MTKALCLSLFTLAVSAGCRGFLAISDWLNSYRAELFGAVFTAQKIDCPLTPAIRRVLLRLDYEAYSLCLAKFFED